MVDYPTLFSAPMVHALIREADMPGTGKTQTRRLIRSARVFATPETPAFTLAGDNLVRAMQGADRFRRLDGYGWFWEADAFEWQAPATRTGWMAHIGYAPGDRLWVREAWRTLTSLNGMTGTEIAKACTDAGYTRPWSPLVYEADGQRTGSGMEWGREKPGRYRHGRFMPRWASRLTLTVAAVRVQRLQAIGESDAIAEGIIVGKPMPQVPASTGDIYHDGVSDPIDGWTRDPVEAYASLWTAINGAGSWDKNPWVLAYTFTVERRNIDNAQTGADHE